MALSTENPEYYSRNNITNIKIISDYNNFNNNNDCNINNNNNNNNNNLLNVSRTYVPEDAETIAEFFAHKNVFITGGTGFLGTVLVEALLSTTPDIGIIYVLVREKHGFDPNERINRMLRKPIFASHSKATLEKVVPVVGELSAPNLGFKEDLLNELCEKVHVVYHGAATIRFSTPLRTAIKTNLTGTMRTIEFAKRLKNLSAYIYLSTAFCNSNNRGLILEEVYKSSYDPYEMMKMAEDDNAWVDFTIEKQREILKDHPNTYTFTKNLAENLMVSEMSGLPAGIVRPSIVYATWEYPIKGWVGNATSGHLGFLAGFLKGVFRTVSGKAESTVDIIPCDYVINSSLVMGWYVATRKLETPEVIHCTSGEVNSLTLGEFTKIINKSVQKHPCDTYLFLPHSKLRTGWRYTLFFYLFQIFPAMLILIPEKLSGLGMTHHTALEYMTVFNKGTKAFDYFLDKNFRYSLKNALRIIKCIPEKDKRRYNFDCTNCAWTEFIDRCLIGLRHYYFRESLYTTSWHRYAWSFMEITYYIGTFGILFLSYFALSLIFGSTLGFTIAFSVWAFLLWL